MYLVVLHLRHKLEYFKNQNWEPDWIKAAEDLVHDKYNKMYAPQGDPVDLPDSQEPITVSVSVIIHHMLTMHQELASNIFDNLPALAPLKQTERCNELTVYPSTGPKVVTNVL